MFIDNLRFVFKPVFFEFFAVWVLDLFVSDPNKIRLYDRQETGTASDLAPRGSRVRVHSARVELQGAPQVPLHLRSELDYR